MRRWIISLSAAAIAAVAVWFTIHRDRIHSLADAWQLAGRQWNSLRSTWGTAGVERTERLRIASFNIQVLGPAKASQADIVELLAHIIRQFDVIAIQELRSEDPAVVQRLLAAVNRDGRAYACTASPALGRQVNLERYLVLYDERTVRLESPQGYVVHDPDDLLRREPLVAWFRTRHTDPRQAFTFSLVNVHLDASRPREELAYLSQLFRAIRNDGRNEDDVIILGDFNAAEQDLQHALRSAGLTWAIRGRTTNTRGTRQYDNVLFDTLATSEFTGSAGVWDFLKEMNLTMQDALRISDHLPVWCEFSSTEGAMESVAPTAPHAYGG
jgi:endonuclease/exonuclease/phosphatase family metal-dependent hydrolase